MIPPLSTVMLYGSVTVVFLIDLWGAFRVRPHWPFIVGLIAYVPILFWVAFALSELAGLSVLFSWASEGLTMLMFLILAPAGFALALLMTLGGVVLAFLAHQHTHQHAV